MNLSLGEYQALTAKALRGVGYSWGMTEDGAFAIRWLAERGYLTIDMTLRLLSYVDSTELSTMVPNPDWLAAGESLCPLSVGVSIADRAGCEALVLGPTLEPLLIAPFLSATVDSGPNANYEMRWGTGRCMVYSNTIALIGALPTAPTPLRIIRPINQFEQPLPTGPRTHRVEIAAESMARLVRFAHRVYAPATDESRNAGAGPE